jgi:hypothetical protein
VPCQATEVARAPASLVDQVELSVGGVVALQRRVGNAATVDMLRGAGLVPVGVANQRLQEARARRPNSTSRACRWQILAGSIERRRCACFGLSARPRRPTPRRTRCRGRGITVID